MALEDGIVVEPSALRQIRNAAAARTLFAALAEETREVAAFAYLDRERRLLGVRHTRSPAHDALDLPIRAITADALAFGAAALVMAHNHPGGDPEPSTADRTATVRLVQLLHPLEVRLLDHLVLTRDACTSFHARGWL